MPEAFDLNIFPILRLNGQDQTEFPGLYAATPPRRAVRGRDRENLVLYISLEGPAWLPPQQQTQLLTRLAQTFYKTSGPLTSVLRKTAELLNRSVLEWNLNHAGTQTIACLTQLVAREDTVVLSHSGPGHAYVLRPEEVSDYSDLEDSGRGLGLSRSAGLRFFQFSLKRRAQADGPEQAFILLTHQPDEVWQVDELQVAPSQGMESMRRKLLVGRTDSDLNAVLIQALPGEGRLRFLRLKPSFQDMARPQADTEKAGPAATPPEAVPDEAVLAGASALAEEAAPLPASEATLPETTAPDLTAAATSQEPTDELADSQPPSPRVQPESLPPAAAAEEISTAVADSAGHPPSPANHPYPSPPRSGRSAASRAQARPRKPAALSELTRELRRVIAAILRVLSAFQAAIASALRQIGGFLFTWLRRVLPDENMLNLSPRTLLFIAIAVPLVVSVIGGMVYIERGQAAQFQRFYDQAVEAAAQAAVKTNPLDQRLAWQTTLDLLDQAEFYRLTPESQALRLQARGSLDSLDSIERLDFQPALLSSLEKTVRITRLATYGGDLYLLNGSQGNVIRAVLTGGGYQIDAQFVCGPVGTGAAVVGPLVDIVSLPRGEESGATIMGVDASGTLILCIPGEQPLIQPVSPPGINFGEIRAFDLNTGDLYYLDPPQNAVWIYRRRETVNPPRLFFGEEIPHMQNVVDLTVSDDDLYLLHADGHQSLCTYLPDSATRCEDPMNYVDMRPGRSGGPVIPDALFTQLQFAPPPDPSLYLLEPESHAVYHFSLRLALQRQYQPTTFLAEGPATAFTVSVNRLVFLAISNQVFYAALP